MTSNCEFINLRSIGTMLDDKVEPEHGNQSRARRPGESEDQMSIAEFGLRPQDSFTSFLPKRYITQPLAIRLRQRDGLSIREAAETLGVPEGTLKAQLARGRAKLVQRFQKAACRPRTKEAIRDAALKRKEYCRPESVRCVVPVPIAVPTTRRILK